MRIHLPLLISVLMGAVVASLLFLLPMTWQSPAPPQRAPEGTNPSDPEMRARLAADALAAARALVAAGRLKEAQERYVEALLLLPGHEQAWAGLIRVRRRLAGDDAALLRRQAEVFRAAIEQGTETEEHYAALAMAILAEASIRAAREVERGPAPIVLGATPQAATSQAKATPAARATARPSPRPASQLTPPAIRRRAPASRPPLPQASPTVRPPRRTPRATPTAAQQRLYLIRAGPLVSPAHLAEVVAALNGAGYAWQVEAVEGTPYYLVALGPHPRSVTDAIVRFLASRFPELTVAVGAVP